MKVVGAFMLELVEFGKWKEENKANNYEDGEEDKELEAKAGEKVFNLGWRARRAHVYKVSGIDQSCIDPCYVLEVGAIFEVLWSGQLSHLHFGGRAFFFI